MAKIKYIVQEGQSIWDVVLLKYGTIEEIGTFLADNTDLTFNTDLTALQEVVINTDVVGDQTIKNNYIITNFVTNNADEGFVAILDQKQFQNGDPFDFQNGDPFQFN